jgi:hypothetical protein
MLLRMLRILVAAFDKAWEAVQASGISREVLETDWLAGHVGFEPTNPPASYLTGIPWQLCLK